MRFSRENILRRKNDYVIICPELKIANTFLSRLKGLMFKKIFEKGSGLLITKCNSIHMFFMKFPLDIVFLDKNLIVVEMVENIKPWKISKIYRNVSSTLELPSGTIKDKHIKIGDQFEICPK